MKRNLKALSLALVAVFALSAMAASSASAQNGGIGGTIGEEQVKEIWLDGTDETTVEEEETGEVNPKTRPLTAFGNSTHCVQAHYTGGEVDGTVETEGKIHHKPLIAPASDFTLTPVYTECTSAGGLPETVTMNGCDYDFHIGETIPGKEDLYEVTSDLTCPEGQEVTIDIYLNEHDHLVTNKPACTIHVPPQNGLKGATITDETNGHLTLGGTVEGIEMTLTGAPCGAEPPVTVEDAKLDLEITLTGTDAATNGNIVKLKITHE